MCWCSLVFHKDASQLYTCYVSRNVIIKHCVCVCVVQYDSPVGPNTRFYECGVELTSDGFYARLDTIQHLTRGTLGLHSLYSLLWANFSSLFVALLTQPNCVERLSGRLFSSGDSIVELCSAQMMKMWDLLCSGLSVSEEERVILVSSCLNRLIEVNVDNAAMVYFQRGSHESTILDFLKPVFIYCACLQL